MLRQLLCNPDAGMRLVREVQGTRLLIKPVVLRKNSRKKSRFFARADCRLSYPVENRARLDVAVHFRMLPEHVAHPTGARSAGAYNKYFLSAFVPHLHDLSGDWREPSHIHFWLFSGSAPNCL
jgi:hypothetical protein